MANAIGMIEFTSIARGMFVADQMVKVSSVEIVTASSACPGKYIAIIHGDVDAVENSIRLGEKLADDFYVDSIIIPNIHPGIFPAISGATMPERIQAIGIIESFAVPTIIIAADAILKEAALEAIEIRLGNGIGGKAYFVFTGDVSAVNAGMESGQAVTVEKGLLVNSEIIPSPSKLLIEHLL